MFVRPQQKDEKYGAATDAMRRARPAGGVTDFSTMREEFRNIRTWRAYQEAPVDRSTSVEVVTPSNGAVEAEVDLLRTLTITAESI